MEGNPAALDQTQAQPLDEQVAARERSLVRSRPPAEIAGYEPQRCLGVGAFGEVWLALDRTTNRLVAIKYFHPRASEDWSGAAREVAQLATLAADRYVVQLLDVGWDARPPYYVMEYLEAGSLEEKLQRDGPLPTAAAVEIFREAALALSHAHEKGILHCDLKPGNVLLDQDNRPRLADFGQARLSTERESSLGTLFYMAPEQTEPGAIPDARWDIYALGALLYQMLVGAPPYRDEFTVKRLSAASSLGDRLSLYRRLVRDAQQVEGHRSRSDIDAELAAILDKCLARDPAERYSSMNEVLAALTERARRRALRPLVALGAIGPAVLVVVVGLAAWWWFGQSWEHSRAALTERALAGLRFAGKNVSIVVGNDLQQRFETVEALAADGDLTALLAEYLGDEDLAPTRTKLNNPEAAEMQLQPLREQLREHPTLEKLQRHLTGLLRDQDQFEYSSWFVLDQQGLQIARSPESNTIGRNYCWRSYYHGGAGDRDRDWRPTADDRLRRTRLSAAFRNPTTNLWTVAISTPVFRPDGSQEFLGVLGLTFDVGRNLIPLEAEVGQFPVLLDTRSESAPGLIIQHPQLDDWARDAKAHTAQLEAATNLRVNPALLTDAGGDDNYRDPVAAIDGGEAYGQRWLAGWQGITVRGRNTGWYVLVQQTYQGVLGQTLDELRDGFLFISLLALIVVALVSGGLWWYCLRMLETAPFDARQGASVRKSTTERTGSLSNSGS